MNERLNKTELLDALRAAHDQLETTLRQLTPLQLREPNVWGEQSAQEMLGHLIYWTHFPLRELDAAHSGQPMVYDEGDEETLNAHAAATYRDRSFDEARADFTRAYQAVVYAIAALPDESFTPDNPLEQALGDTLSNTFNNNTYEHWLLHVEQVRTHFGLV